MKLKRVSIIIPAYNAGAYIAEAVRSACNQDYKNIEIVLVNDGSTDNTETVARKVAPDLVYIYQENKGLAAARNAGIKASTGEYVAFLDSDDIFLPKKISHQVAALEAHPDYGVSYCDLLHMTDEPKPKFFHHRYSYPSGDVFPQLLERQFVNPVTVLARRHLFDRCGYFDETLRRSEDWDLWLRWSRAGVAFLFLNEVLAHYRLRREGNLSSVASEPAMKEKNLFIFERLAGGMSPKDKQRFHMEALLKRLRLKTALAYLMIADTSAAERFITSPRARALVNVLPARVVGLVLRIALRLKHRLLLQSTDITS